MSASVLPVLVYAEEARRQLPMPAVAYGMLAFVGFLVLLGVTWSFRNSANKVRSGHGRHGEDGLRGDHH